MRLVWTVSWKSCAAFVRFFANYAQEFLEPDAIRIAPCRISPEAFLSTRKRRIGSERILRSVCSPGSLGNLEDGQAAAAANGCDAPILRIRGPRPGSRLVVVRRRRHSRERLTPSRSVRRDGLAGHPSEDPSFRSVRSASFGVRAGGSERGRCVDSAACRCPRKSALGPVRSPSGIDPSARRAAGRGCLQPVRRVPAGGSRSRSRARPCPSHGSGFCARSLDARSGPLERDRIQSGPAASSCRSPPAPEASGALRSGARCAGTFTGSRRT